jgi:two-component system phosphate regulon sensor histidine kinase PhoR
MQRVVEDLISLSRIEAEKFTTPTEAVDLEQLIEVSIESAKRMAEDRRSTLVCDIEPNLPNIAADGTQILQVLDNLITNALRYGEPGTPVTFPPSWRMKWCTSPSPIRGKASRRSMSIG